MKCIVINTLFIKNEGFFNQSFFFKLCKEEKVKVFYVDFFAL